MQRGDYVRVRTGGQVREKIVRVCRVTGAGICTIRDLIGSDDGGVRGLRLSVGAEKVGELALRNDALEILDRRWIAANRAALWNDWALQQAGEGAEVEAAGPGDRIVLKV